MIHPTFEDRCIVSCGMLYPELTHLMETGFLNSLVYTRLAQELENNLPEIFWLGSGRLQC
jgi:hypothetical protein